MSDTTDDNDPTTAGVQRRANGVPLDPVVSARVPVPFRDKIDALRGLFPAADGHEAARSDVLRAMLVQAEALFDASAVRAVRDVARTQGWDMPTAWRRVIEAGLRALREDGESDSDDGGSR